MYSRRPTSETRKPRVTPGRQKLCGWRTRSVFDRYRIVAERDLAEGLAKLPALPATVKPRKTVRMGRR
jgi:hypothetical protein